MTKRVKVKCKSIRSIGYDKETKILEVIDKGRGIANFYDVPKCIFKMLLRKDGDKTLTHFTILLLTQDFKYDVIGKRTKIKLKNFKKVGKKNG